jgi:hypothetical protein
LLVVGQLLEIIFTFFTLKVCCDPEAPAAPEEAELDPAAPLLLGLAPAEADPDVGDPVMRTSWPTWSLSFEVSPAS